MEKKNPSNPDLSLAQQIFLLKYYRSNSFSSEVSEVTKEIQTKLQTKNMSLLYEELCQDFQWEKDELLLTNMKKKNNEMIKILDDSIQDSVQNLGESEIRDAMLAKAEYYSSIGNKELSLQCLNETFRKTIALGYRLDILFHIIRIGFFWMDYELVASYIEKAHQLVEEGGDWERRNRLKVYQGLYKMSIRDFQTASTYFLETVSTFASTEILTFETFIFYSALCSIISLDRVAFKEKVLTLPEISQVSIKKPIIKELLVSFYNCHYSEFFEALVKVEEELKVDRYLSHHYKYYIREMRLKAYNQLLFSYLSVSIFSMSNLFGVSEYFIDREISHFISLGRLKCKIDKVAGIIITNHSDANTNRYEQILQSGDYLLNKVQKLNRMIEL